ncbi:hypothetical protein BH24ACT12_BH24ACT12_24510 [soil metagenome]
MTAEDFPVFASSIAVFGTSKDQPGQLGQPITVRGVQVSTGNLVVADTAGIVILPRAEAAAIIQRADQRAHHEERVITGLRAGHTTVQLYGLLPPDDNAQEKRSASPES